MRYRLTAPLLRLSKLDQYIIKMQGLPVTQLSPVLGEQRLRDIHEMNRPGRILRILLFSSKKMREFMQSMNPDIYPFQGGVGLISQKLAELCRSRAIKITCNAHVEQVPQADGRQL